MSLDDIVVALSRIQRGGGHYRFPYTVAQHSVMVSEIVPTLAALLHDAAEAYIGDVLTPIKAACPELCAIENRIQAAIAAHFGIDTFARPEIKHADLVALATERRDLVGPAAMSWGDLPDPAAEPIHTWHSEWYIKERFLSRFHELQRAT